MSNKLRQKMIKTISKGELYEHTLSYKDGNSVLVDEESVTFISPSDLSINDVETARDVIALLTAWVVRQSTIQENGVKR